MDFYLCYRGSLVPSIPAFPSVTILTICGPETPKLALFANSEDSAEMPHQCDTSSGSALLALKKNGS